VVILNDLGIISSPGFAEIDQAIFAGLQKSPYQIELYHESLEITLFPDEVSQRRFREEFIQKYSDRRPDIIIAVGSASFKFVVETQERFLRDTPIIFCAILGRIPEESRPNMQFTGVLGKLHPEETLTAALHMLPNTKHVVVIGGIGAFDEAFEDAAKQGFQNLESKLEFTYLTTLSMPALLEQLKHLPSDTIVYHTAITKDAAGTRFIDSAQSIPLVTGASNAPTFVMDDIDLRGGTVGGDLVNWSDDGRVAAEMAVKVLNGEKTQDIPIVTSNDAYMFDWHALQRWGIKESDLPPGSIVLNRSPNFWQLYKRYVLAAAVALFTQTFVIFLLLWQRAKWKESEAKLRESENRFRLVANTSPVMIWMSEPDKQCNYFNQPWIDFTGGSLESQLGNGWSDGVHLNDLHRCLDTYTKAFDQRESFRMEYRMRRHDGEYRWVLDIGVPRFNSDGSFAGYIGSCIDVTDRKEAEEALSTVSRRLIEAHEEERTRIARELHDDINQRLALLSVNLSNLIEGVPASDISTKQGVEQVRQELSDLGSDVQALSHRLHSSKLEYLGLAVAANGFCKEFSARHNIEILFHYKNIHRNLPSEISLCLFRVLQEALQNALKYSGTRRFEARLEGTSSEIHLSVQDSGVGFNPESAMHHHGLGLISMTERMKLVGGQLSIDSKPQCGTTVHARVPLSSKLRSEAQHDTHNLQKTSLRSG
jgi:PAS domain S-box-containing protein